MDINKIEMILCALELGSFSKAAEKYCYTPSALTHIANALEEEIGASFIRRTHSGIEAENEEIVKGLRSICDTKDYLCSLGKNDNTLTIGTYSSASKYLFPKIVKKFSKIHPEIHINLTVVNLLSELMYSGADILFGNKQSSDEHSWIEIMSDSYVVVVPESRKYKELNLDKAYPETFILTTDTDTINAIKKEHFRDIIKIDAHDDSSVLQMVKADIGISVLPSLSVYESVDGVKVLPISPSFSRTLGFTYKKSSKKIKLIREFTEFFKSEIK